jgi:hypothetical protein
LPPAARADLPLFIAEPDFMSLPAFMSLLDEPDDIEPDVLPDAPDFMSVDDEPAPVPDPVAGDVADVLPLAAGDDGDF